VSIAYRGEELREVVEDEDEVDEGEDE